MTQETTPSLPTISMLWIEGQLTNLEKVSIRSFAACGHPVSVYSYDPSLSLPEGAVLCDARGVLPENQIFRNETAIGKGSWGPFSDLFRFTLLSRFGGIWCDTDLICLKPLDFVGERTLFATEYFVTQTQGGNSVSHQATTCFISARPGDPLINECLNRTVAIGRNQQNWADSGPGVIRKLISEGVGNNTLLNPDIFCSIPHWEFPQLLQGFRQIHPMAYGIHCWNEVWRWNFVDKNMSFDELSIFERLKKHYL
jgi:hypothetical protein